MTMFLLIGAGAGLVSALLFGVMATLSPLALLLSYIAPLPVLIAALGWNHRSGLVAALTGAVLCAVFLAPTAAVVFAVAVALPAWWLAYLSLLGRPGANEQFEWYPIGRVLLWIVAIAALVTLIGAISLGPTFASYEAALHDVIRVMIRPDHESALFEGTDVDQVVGIVAMAVPAVAASTFVYMLVINLWIAASTVRLSQRLPRAWPSIPDTLMPRSTLLALGFALIGSVILSGFAGLAAVAVLGALGAALSLQGMAAIHVATRGNRARTALLAMLYASLLLLSVWVMPLLALVGIAAIALRKTGQPPRPPASR